MAETKNKKVSYSEKNKTKVEGMLERDPGNIRAVVANTIETRRIAGKLPIIDTIFNRLRANVGVKYDFKDMEEMLKQFNTVIETLDKIIQTGEDLGLYVSRENRESEFKQHKEKLEKFVADGVDAATVAKELNINEQKAASWLGTIKTDQAKETVKTTKKTA